MGDRAQSTGWLGAQHSQKANQQCWDLAPRGQSSEGQYVPGGVREDLVTV